MAISEATVLVLLNTAVDLIFRLIDASALSAEAKLELIDSLNTQIELKLDAYDAAVNALPDEPTGTAV